MNERSTTWGPLCRFTIVLQKLRSNSGDLYIIKLRVQSLCVAQSRVQSSSSWHQCLLSISPLSLDWMILHQTSWRLPVDSSVVWWDARSVRILAYKGSILDHGGAIRKTSSIPLELASRGVYSVLSLAFVLQIVLMTWLSEYQVSVHADNLKS